MDFVVEEKESRMRESIIVRRLNMGGKKFLGGSSIQRTPLWER